MNKKTLKIVIPFLTVAVLIAGGLINQTTVYARSPYAMVVSPHDTAGIEGPDFGDFIDDGYNAIESVLTDSREPNNARDTTTIYSLDGKRLNTVGSNMVYIKNGKKFITRRKH